MRKKYTRRARKPGELMLVPMIDIFTVLVTFLLMTAVFSRITIVDLDIPSSASPIVAVPAFRLEVIVRDKGFELTNGRALIATIPKVNGEYDLKSLSELATALKRDYPEAAQASVLLEPDIAYDHLIQVMDAIRTAELPDSDPIVARTQKPAPQTDLKNAGAPKLTRVALFTDVAVGDAP
jgi:biopolymer transport protein ExbD